MERKNTSMRHKLPPINLYTFIVGINGRENHQEIEIVADRMEADVETLKAYRGEEIVGQFCEWLYYYRNVDLERGKESEYLQL